MSFKNKFKRLVAFVLVQIMLLSSVHGFGMQANAEENEGNDQALITLDWNADTESIVSGERIALTFQLTVPPTESGGTWKNPNVIIDLPLMKYLDKESISVSGVIVDGFSIMNDDALVLNLKPALESGNAETILVTMDTNNFVIPDGTILKFPLKFNVNYAGTAYPPQNVEASVAVTASDGWRVEKAVKEVNSSKVNKVKVDGVDYYEVAYTVDAINQTSAVDNSSEQDVWNRNGRLNFETDESGNPMVSIVDTLPTGYPAGGGAQLVSVSTVGRGTLTAGTDYVAETNSAGEVTSITFKTLDTLKEADAASMQYAKAGTPIDTEYTVTLRYPVKPYLSTQDEDLKTYDLKNTATLNYKLIGEDPVAKSDDAQITLGEYDGVTESADIVVEKWIQVGDSAPILLNVATRNTGVDTAAFALFTSADGGIIANNINNQPAGTKTALNDEGCVVFHDLRVGKTFYLEEIEVPDGFGSFDDRLQVDIDMEGNVRIVNAPADGSVKVVNNKIQIINKADANIGSLEFWKEGLDSSNTKKIMSGVTFQISNGTATYTAVSDGEGRVYFPAVIAGDYTLKETNMSVDDAKEYPYAADRTLTITAGAVTHPDWDGTAGADAKPVFLNLSNKGRIEITKQDRSDASKLLGGASFGVYKNSTCLEADRVGILVTGDDGKAVSESMEEGTYYLKEISAPAGYALSADVTEVTVQGRETVSVILQNDAKLPLSISKVGALGRGQTSLFEEPLENVRFKIYNSENGNEPLAEVITYLDATNHSTSKLYENTESGEIKKLYLEPGTYWIEEVAESVPEGYAPANNRIKVTLDENNQEFRIVNYADYGQIKITKVNAKDTAKQLSGAEFAIYDNAECTGTPVDTITTDTNGEATSKLLPIEAKKYYIKEVKAPAGFVAMTEVIKGVDAAGNATTAGDGIELKLNEQINITASNTPKVSIEITKKDSVTQEALTGAGFTLYEDAEATKQVKTATPDGNGAYVFSDLEPGTTYYYKETTTPSGYIGDTEIHTITTPAKDSADVWVRESVENIRYGKLLINKTATMDGTKSAMGNVEFKLYAENADLATATPIATVKTDGSGNASIDNLAPGTYKLVETKVDGYTPVTQTVVISAGENQGTAYNKQDEIESIHNDADSGKIKIKKTDSYGTRNLANVEFALYKKSDYTNNNNSTNGLTAVTTLKTDTSGEAITGWIAPGDYVLVETKAAANYILDDTVRELTVTAGVTNTTYTDTNAIKNTAYGKVNIYKQSQMDSTKTNMSGVIFELYTVTNDDKKGELAYTSAATGSDGQTSFDNVVPGTYILVEQAVTDYQTMTEQKITIVAGQNIISDITAKPIEVVNIPSNGKVTLEKVSSLNSETKLPGAVFQLYKETTTDVYETTAAATLTTGDDGKVTSGWLAPGKYKVVEETAPDGYVKNENAGYVTIEAGKTNTALTGNGAIKNEPMGKISITKNAVYTVVSDEDAYTISNTALREPLQGATFEVYKKKPESDNAAEDRKKAPEIITINMSNSSSATTGYLAAGEYWVVETIAPTGFTKAAPIAVTVVAGQTVAASNTGLANVSSVDNTPNFGKLRFFKYDFNKYTKNSDNDDALLDGAQFELYVVDEKNGTAYTIGGKEVKLTRIVDSASVDSAYLLESGTHGKGSAVSNNLKPGQYYLKEVSVSASSGQDWKWFNDWTGPIEVKAGQETIAPYIFNYYGVEGVGTKTDANVQNKMLSGAYFAAFKTKEDATAMIPFVEGWELLLPNDAETDTKRNEIIAEFSKNEFYKTHNIVSIAKSEANGGFTLSGLTPGETYYVMEILPPEGYGFNPKIEKVTVVKDANGNWGFDVNLSFSDVEYGRLQVVKYTKLSDIPFAVEGVDFNVYRAVVSKDNATTKYSITKDNITTYYTKKDAAAIASGTTDANGLYTSVLIPAGTYIVEEDTTKLPPTVTAGTDTYRIITVTVGTRAEDDGANYSKMETGSGIFNPAAYGKFILKKVDAANTETQLAATFKVDVLNEDNMYVPVKVKKDGKEVDYTITTSTSEVTESIYLAPGTYRLTEITAPDGYTLDAAPHTITIAAGQLTGAGNKSTTNKSAPFVITNNKQGSLVIEKIAAFNNGKIANLGGVTFNLYKNTGNAEGTPVKTNITTGNDGKVTVNNLDAGNYWLVETSEGTDTENLYQVDSTPIPVTITSGQTTYLTDGSAVKNVIQAGKIALKKTTDYTEDVTATIELREVIGGTVSTSAATIYSYNGNTLVSATNMTLTKDAPVISGYVKPGTYRVVETATDPAGYSMVGEVTVTVEAGKITYASGTTTNTDTANADPVIVSNKKLGKIAVEKIGVLGTQKLEALKDVTFKLYARTSAGAGTDCASSATVIATLTTGLDGKVTSDWLNPGDYWLVETALGTGYTYTYTLDSTPKAVTIVQGQTTDLTSTGSGAIKNNTTYGKLQLTKVDYNSSDTKLSGAVFTVHTTVDCTDTAVDTITTNAQGVAVTKLLPTVDASGKEIQYWVKETEAPSGYEEMVSDKISGPYTLEANATRNVATITNKKLFEIEVEKVDASDAEKTLAGAVFAIYATEADAGAKTNKLDKKTTGTDGKVVFSNLTIDDAESDKQIYYIRELISPSGYAVNDTIYPVELNYADSKVTYTQQIKNTLMGDITLHKTATWDGKTIDLAGVTFDFYPVSGEGQVHVGNVNPADTQVTDEKGELKTDRLPAGWYEVVETVPYGYQMGDGRARNNSLWVQVTDGTTNTELYDTAVVNTPVMGSFKLEKRASDKETLLSGAEFYLYRKDAEGIYRLVDDTNDGIDDFITVTTKEGGEILYESGMLQEGDYKLIEKKAPTYTKTENGVTNVIQFALNTTHKEFSIIAGKVTMLTGDNAVINYPKMSVILTKIKDEQNGGAPLPDAKFGLYTDSSCAEGKKVGEAVSGGDGKAIWTNVSPGTYYIKEMEAPTGYTLSTAITTVVVPEVERLTDLTVNVGNIVNHSNQGQILIRKLTENGTLLPGAEFEIYKKDANGAYTVKVKDGLTTDNSGVVYSGLLSADTNGTWYKVVETKAPEGYSLDDRLYPTEAQVLVYPIHTPVYTSDGENRNVATFRNKTENSIAAFQANIAKQIKDDDEDFGTSVSANESLLEKEYTATFRIKDLANGENDLPMNSFVVTDETITLYSKDAQTGNYVAFAADDESYVINNVVIYKASNQASSEVVTYTLEYKTSRAGDAWVTAASGDFSATTAAGETVDLSGKGAVAIRVSYGNVGKGFTAKDGFDMNVTFAKREGNMIGDKIPEVRRITNKAVLTYKYSVKNKNGNVEEITVTPHSNEVEALIPTITEHLPQVLITNKITNLPHDQIFYTGNNVNFQVRAINVKKTEEGSKDVDFKAPIITVDLPVYTTLTDAGFTVYQNILVDGVPQRMILKEGVDFTLVSAETEGTVGMVSGEFVRDEAVSTERYIFKFGDHITLAPDESTGEKSNITILYSASLDYDKPSNQTALYSPAYLSSSHKLPMTKENPLGTSFTGYHANVQGNADLDEDIKDTLEYLNQPVDFTVLNATKIQLVKTVSDRPDTGYSNAQVNVYPTEQVYYNLTLFNNSDSEITKARYVDILPFKGDSYVFRSGGGTTQRLTSIPTGEGYEEMELVAVTPENDYATVYYFVENGGTYANSWAYANRRSTSATAELPMLYTAEGETVWTTVYDGYWTTTVPTDMSTVTAIAIEVNFPANDTFRPSERYNVNVTMRTPGYTADKIDEYAGKVMANSVAAAVVRKGETQIVPSIDIVEPNKVLVGLELPVGSLGDYAWYDFNSNGLQDDGDSSAAANVKVALYQTTLTKVGNVIYRSEQKKIAETLTNGEGWYEFTDLPCNYLIEGREENSTNPEDYVGRTIYYYQVKFEIPAEHSATIRYEGNNKAGASFDKDSNIDGSGWTEEVVLKILDEVVDGKDCIVGENNPTLDAGFIIAVGLGDKVWIDVDHDGIQGENEPGLPKTLVRLYRLNSPDEEVSESAIPYATDYTDENGEYLFENLPEGYYVVEFDIRAITKDGYTYQYAFTYPNKTESKLTTPDDSDAENPVDPDNRVMRTDVIPLLFEENEEIERSGNRIDRTWDAGVYVYSALGGYVFEDKDYTNLQDMNRGDFDIPLPGTAVKLYTVSNGVRADEPLRETVVGADGRYFFDELDAGQYQVYFDFPDNYVAVESMDTGKTSDNNFSDTDDSDLCIFDGTYNDGFTQIITLGYDTVDRTWDAGANLLGAIGDYVWFDTNRDGIQDSNETPLEDVTVRLQYRRDDSAQWADYPGGITTTDENGKYLFEGLKGGDEYPIMYRVIFDLYDPDITVTMTNAGTDSTVDSDALAFYLKNLGYATTTITLDYGETDLTWDAGIFETVCGVGDFVWFDTDKDGIQDEGEKGVKNIPVVLEKSTGDINDESSWKVVGTTKTNENGYYRFLDLIPGYYRVRFQIEDPYIVTLYNRGTGENAYVWDSDASREGKDSWYYSRVFYLQADEYDMTWDAGLYLPEKPTVPAEPTPSIIPDTHITESVKTGDDTSVWLWIVLLVVSASASIGLIIGKKNKKGSRH